MPSLAVPYLRHYDYVSCRTAWRVLRRPTRSVLAALAGRLGAINGHDLTLPACLIAGIDLAPMPQLYDRPTPKVRWWDGTAGP
jgi:hypothetical protein